MPDKALQMEMPSEAVYLWRWFVEIHNSSDCSPTQMQAYFALRGLTPQPWEVEVLTELFHIKQKDEAAS